MIKLKKILLIWLIVFTTTYAYSQGGVIEGIVTDLRTKETLPGAQILVVGTTIGTTANLNGEFRLTNIPEGIVDLQFSFISYQPLIIEQIKIERGSTHNLNIEMEEVSQILEGVTITARRATYTETSLIQSIRTNQVVTSGISSQQISRAQDTDAAQVVRRIPGVIIVDDRFIVIRGLSERYNVTMLHNTIAPSIEADVRSFSFDMVPSSQIDHLFIYKSPSPELPGDFAGGAVKIFTRSIPERNLLEFSYSGRWDDGTTNEPFFITDRSANAWTSFGSSHFALPTAFPNDLRAITNDPEALQQAGRSLKNNWIPTETRAPLSHSGSLSGGLRFNLGKNIRIGNISTVTYSNSKSSNSIFRGDYHAFNHDQDRSLPIYLFEDARYTNSIRVGVLHNWGIELGEKHSFEIINLFNNSSSYSYTNRIGDHIGFGFDMNNHAFQQVFRRIYTGQVSGKHQVLENTNLDWTYGRTSSFKKLPDYKQYRTDRDLNWIEGDTYRTYMPIGGAQPYFLGRFYSNMEESGNTYSLNLSQKIPFNLNGGSLPEFKAGVFFSNLERDFRARNIGFTASSVNFDQNLRDLRIDELFNPENINNSFGFKIDEQSNPNDSYFAANHLFAWYSMLNIPFGNLFTISGGIRVENNQRILKSATTEGIIDEDNTTIHILPSLNATLNFTEKLLLRGGFGQTVNRPEFREQAPFSFFDFENNIVISGFPFLKTAFINNYDLRLEFYPSLSEIISLSGFYKQFENAIERIFISTSGGNSAFSFGNTERAFVYGSELEIRKSLGALTRFKFIDDLSVYFNATLLVSEVEIGSGSRSQGRDTDPRPLQGQAPYIVNAGIFYNNIERNLEVNILYNIIGKRIFSGGVRELDGTISYPDIYEMPRNYLDLAISKRLTRNVSLRVKIDDILNEPVIFLQDANEDGTFDKNNDQLIRRYKPGTSIRAGLVFRL